MILHTGALGRGSKGVATSDHLSLAKRLTTVEMKEMNEKQRANHAVRMQDKLRNTVHELESRNLELEQKFAEVCVCQGGKKCKIFLENICLTTARAVQIWKRGVVVVRQRTGFVPLNTNRHL